MCKHTTNRIRLWLTTPLLFLFPVQPLSAGETTPAPSIFEWIAEDPSGRVRHLFEVATSTADALTLDFLDEDGAEILTIVLPPAPDDSPAQPALVLAPGGAVFSRTCTVTPDVHCRLTWTGSPPLDLDLYLLDTWPLTLP